MIRDDRMAQLVAKEKEPITPFIKKVRSLYEKEGVSSIVVVGGSGDYFEVADCVVMMDCYAPKDVTTEAHAISDQHGGVPVSKRSPAPPFGTVAVRKPIPQAFTCTGKITARSLKKIQWGDGPDLDLLGVEQLVEMGQVPPPPFFLSPKIVLFRYFMFICRRDASWTVCGWHKVSL
jgi:predicted ABC-class ATPase